MLKSPGQHGASTDAERKEPRVFVIHAGEDKDSFVRPLVGKLQEKGLNGNDIFYDDVSIQPGDVIRDRIMSTLSSESLKLAVIVVSNAFLSKPYWPRLEYETCLQNNKHIFPIWVDANEDNFTVFSESVGKYSPTLKQMSGRRVQRDDVTNALPTVAAEIIQRLCTLRYGQPEAIQTHLHIVPSPSESDSSDLEEETSIGSGAGITNEQSTEDILKAKHAQLELIEKVGEAQLQRIKQAEGLLPRETVSQMTKYVLDDLYQHSLRIIGVKMGSVIIHIVPNDLSTLDRFWRDYKSGRLSKLFTDRLVTDEMRAAAGMDLAVRVVMLDQQYRQWTEYFNTRDMTQMVQKLPSLSMTPAPSRLSKRPSVSPNISESRKTIKMTDEGPADVYNVVSSEKVREVKEKKAMTQTELVEREQIKLQEVEKRRQFLKQMEREKQMQAERLKRLQQESLREREKLLKYCFGDKHGPRFFTSIDIQDMQESVHGVRIGVFGPSGSGKSCLINTCERALGLTTERTCRVDTNQPEGTILLQEYLDDIGKFCLVETRGFFNYKEKEFMIPALSNILYGRIKPGEMIDLKAMTTVDEDDSWDIFPSWLHAVVFVLSAHDPLLLNGAHEINLSLIHEFMRLRGQRQEPVGPNQNEGVRCNRKLPKSRLLH